MSVATERMIVGRGFPHQNTAITFNTTSTQFAMTNSASYNATGTTSATFKRACGFALVSNDDPTNFITVEVGSDPGTGGDTAPNAAVAGSRRVYPRTQEWIQLEDAKAVLAIKADTANCAGAINWYPGRVA